MDFTQRWLLMLAIATALFAISLLLLRVNIRTLAILLGLGLPIVTLWMYVDEKYLSGKRRSATTNQQNCICPVCKHESAKVCLEEKCSCCLITKGEKVVGHSSSPLQ
jgi:hypothetical protein